MSLSKISIPYMAKQQEKTGLEAKLIELDKKLDEYVSFKKSFTVGVVRGLGSAIGATIVFAVLIVVLDRLLRDIGSIPVLDPIIEYLRQNILGTI